MPLVSPPSEQAPEGTYPRDHEKVGTGLTSCCPPWDLENVSPMGGEGKLPTSPPVFGSGRRMCHLTKPRFVADWRLLRFVLLVSSTSCGEYLSQGPRKGRTGASNLVPYPRLK